MDSRRSLRRLPVFIFAVMRVLGIDPSFTRTGLSILDSELGVIAYTSIEVPKVLKEGGNIFHFDKSFQAATWHAKAVRSWLTEYDDSVDAVFVEMPAMLSGSGPYLLPLQCMLYTEFQDLRKYSTAGLSTSHSGPFSPHTADFYLIPPTAINSLVRPSTAKKRAKKGEIPEAPPKKISKEEGKKLIVQWVLDHYSIAMNHDEASAVILAAIGLDILAGIYKKTYQLCPRLQKGLFD